MDILSIEDGKTGSGSGVRGQAESCCPRPSLDFLPQGEAVDPGKTSTGEGQEKVFRRMNVTENPVSDDVKPLDRCKKWHKAKE
jgi:hypothetical protein